MYRLTLLGGVFLDGPEGPVEGRATQQRRLALLALLGSVGDMGRSRDQLIAFLWPETDASEARQHLSHSIYVLRQSLGEQAVRTAGEYVRLSPSHVAVDSRLFEGALEESDRERAARLYGGAFMDGFFIDEAPEFERWVDEERRRLAKRYTQVLVEEAAEADRMGNAAESVKWWGRLVDQDPYNSATIARLMESLCASGDPANALYVAREHRERLEQDLGVGPTPEVEALEDSIRQAREPSRGEAKSSARSPATELDQAISETEPAKRRSGYRVATMATATIIVIVLVAVWTADHRDPWAGDASMPSVAVIPFMNLTGAADNEYIVDGVSDQLIATLSRVPDLMVPAQTSSFVFKNRPQDVRVVADSLGVETILEGSVGPGFRVTAQLINGETGFHLWTQTYEEGLSGLPALPAEIVREAVQALGIELQPSWMPHGAKTRVAAAWQDYAKARHWWSKRTPAGTDTAIVYFRRAVDEDPAWALAWSGLADAHVTGRFWGHLPDSDSLETVVRDAASRAVELDSTLAEARASYAAVLHDFDQDDEAAARELERSLELNPNYAVAHLWYGETLFMDLGRYEEGLRQVRMAYELDPLSPIMARLLGDFLWWSPGGAEEALRYYDIALDLEPGHWPSHSNKAIALACLTREHEARAALALLRDSFPDVPRAQLDAADVLGILRDHDEAGVVIDRIREDFPAEADYSSYFSRIAIGVYVEQGRYAAAMAEYRRLADLIISHSPNTLALWLAWIYARSGDEEAARTVLESVPSDRRPRQRAGVLAALGDHDQALELLRRVVEEEWVVWDAVCLAADPDFDDVRTNPKYIDLMARIGQPVSD